MADKWEKDEEVESLREYLRIPSVHPNIDYGDCVTFLRKQAKSMDLPVVVYEFAPKKPVVVITWAGSQPLLPAILCNSHMDVVPVYEEHWTYPPFEAVISDDGYIYARGSQDMKSIGMMHIEAVRRLKNAGVALKRTVHLSFVPDEEIGSEEGMKKFSESKEFKDLNIGFGLDESVPSTSDKIILFNGERCSRQIKITCRGVPGHGSLLNEGTAGEKLHYVINKFMKLREQEKKKFDTGTNIGEVITINLTQLEGGVQINVLPENLSVSFDIRIPPNVDHQKFEDTISSWCKDAGEGVSIEYYVKNPEVKSTPIDGSVPFWTTLKETIEKMGKQIKCYTCPGATDARFVRMQGIPAINLSPLVNTPILLHAHDERVHAKVYKDGVAVMQNVLAAVANVEC